MLLLLVGLLTLAALKVGAIEQKSTGNDVRERVVVEVAEAGLAQGIEYLMRQHPELLEDPARWERCPADDSFPCGAISTVAFDHDGDPATPAVSRRTQMYRLRADDTYTIPDIDPAMAKFMLPLSTKIATLPNGWTAAYGVAPVVCFAERAPNPGAGGIPCGDGGAGAIGLTIATLVSVAKLPGEAASQTLVQTVGQYPKLDDDLMGLPPITASGSAGVTGTLQVVTNPNSGGPGVPVSVWSRLDVAKTGTTNTCYADEFFRYPPGGRTPSLYQGTIRCDECRCDAKGAPQTLSYDSSGNVQLEGIDVLDVDTGTNSATGYHLDGHVGVNFNVRSDALSYATGTCEFPSDLFRHVFGTDTWNDTDGDCFGETKADPVVYQNPDNGTTAMVGPDEAYLYQNAVRIIPSPANAALVKAGQAGTTALLSAASTSGIVWCQRDPQNQNRCDIRSNVQVGTPNAPVILVLDGPVSIQGTVFGIVFIRDTGTALDPATGSSMAGACPNDCILTMNAGAAVYGALLMQGQMKSNGTSAVIHDGIVLRNIVEQSDPVYATLSGAWNDLRSY
jgi:hypothetical protein